MAKVLISDKLADAAVEILSKVPDIEVDFRPDLGKDKDELIKALPGVDALAIRSGTKVTAEILEHADNLKVIGRAGMGVDNVDLEAATRKGVVVMNTPGGNSITTAEHAISMMMSLARNIPQACAKLKAGKWDKKSFMGVELSGKTLGVIGLGNIGKIVADRAKGLKMRVIAFDPLVPKDLAASLEVQIVELDELFERSDFITLHVPSNPRTVGMINRESISKMKKGVRIINCSRGGIVDEDDLLEALNSGHVGGAALDVFSKEPPGDAPIISHDKVICTPHLGASTGEAQEKVAVQIAEQIVDYLGNGTIQNAVNVPSVSGEVLKIIGPYLNLAERLGKFQGQMVASSPLELTVEYSGHVLDHDVAPITLTLLKGFLEPIVRGNVNYVNASHIAKDRGIKVVESRLSESESFVSLISLKVRTSEGESAISGTIFGKTEPRIVRLNDVDLDAIPTGVMLVLKNHDKPGVIGSIGTTLGESGVNINRMALGLDRATNIAYSIINVDSSPGPEAIEKLSKLPNMISVSEVAL